MRSAIKHLAAVLVTGMLFLPAPVLSKIYKWVDEQGNVQFTDDESKIPPKFREKDKVKTIRPIQPLQSPGGGEEGGGKAKAPAGDKSGKKPAAQLDDVYKDAINEAIPFLESEIQKDQEIVEAFPNEGISGATIFDKIQSTLSGKQAIVSKLEGAGLKDAPDSLTATHEFLKASLAADEEFNTLGPRFKMRLKETQDRARSEMDKAGQLIESLKKDLESPPPPKAEGK